VCVCVCDYVGVSFPVTRSLPVEKKKKVIYRSQCEYYDLTIPYKLSVRETL